MALGIKIHRKEVYKTPSRLTPAHRGDTRLCMKGRIHTKENCPKCGGRFEDTGADLQCPSCMTTPKKYHIAIYHKGLIRIYSDSHGNPLDSFERADRLLNHIRHEIDEHKFDAANYRKSDLNEFRFETRIDYWYDSKEKEVEKGNLAPSYTKCLRVYIKNYYKPFFMGKDVRDIRTHDIAEFYSGLPSGKELKYLKNIINALENFINTLEHHEYISKKPKFPVITVNKTTPEAIDLESQLRVLQTIPVEDVPIFQFLMFQGIRPGEARALKVKDFIFKDGNETITVARTFSERILRERVKGKKVAPRKLNPMLVPMLKGLCRGKLPEAFVFINPRTGRFYSENATRRIWKKVRVCLSLNATLYQATRHSFATIMHNDCKVPIIDIQQMLSHTDVRTTLKYTHVNMSSQNEAFGKHAELVLLRMGKASLETGENK